MNLAPLLCIGMMAKQPFLLLVDGLLLTVLMISVISTISYVDLSIILLLLRGPLATWFKELSSGLGGLNAYIGDCEQISHHFGLLHSDLLNCFEITNPVAGGIDTLDVLDVQDDVSGVAEMFHVVLETLIMLLLDGL
jgi:hypothetical protein